MSLEPVTQPPHPGIQCHEAHPGIPHTVLTAPSQDEQPGADRPLMPLPPIASSILPRIGTTAPDWSRFDEWATRALEYMGAAVGKADEAAPGQISEAQQARQEAARLCVSLATSASPYSMGTTAEQLPTITLGTLDLDE